MKSHQHPNRSLPFPNAPRCRSRRRAGVVLLLCALACASPLTARAAYYPPVVGNVTAAQRVNTKLVDIHYTISDPDSIAVNIDILVSADGGATWTVPAYTFTGDYGHNVAVTATPTAKSIVWNAGADWDHQYTERCRVRVLANDGGQVLILAGSYARGNDRDNDILDAPPYSVYVGAFYIETTLVNGVLWSRVYDYATITLGYTFDNAGSYKAASHPVQSINWFDAVKWCNARSQMEGREAVYYTDAGFGPISIYKRGQVAPYIKPTANGYRLPTEAEWEKAARGGLSSNRFPWGSFIDWGQADYQANGLVHIPYDNAPGVGYNPAYNDGQEPYTSPVASFAPNGYGLFDMAGDVAEWCWDWYDSSYYSSGQTDPQGPSSGTGRVLRGGSWNSYATNLRSASRESDAPSDANNTIGFRCVMRP